MRWATSTRSSQSWPNKPEHRPSRTPARSGVLRLRTRPALRVLNSLVGVLCTTNPEIRCQPRRNVAFRGDLPGHTVCICLVAAPPRCGSAFCFALWNSLKF
jgi:hypothetical protein